MADVWVDPRNDPRMKAMVLRTLRRCAKDKAVPKAVKDDFARDQSGHKDWGRLCRNTVWVAVDEEGFASGSSRSPVFVSAHLEGGWLTWMWDDPYTMEPVGLDWHEDLGQAVREAHEDSLRDNEGAG